MRRPEISRRMLPFSRPLRAVRLLSLFFALLIPGAVTAQAPKLGTDASGNTTRPDCYCRAGGKTYAMGQQICLAVPGQAGLFRCEMEQNVTNWKAMGQPCPQS